LQVLGRWLAAQNFGQLPIHEPLAVGRPLRNRLQGQAFDPQRPGPRLWKCKRAHPLNSRILLRRSHARSEGFSSRSDLIGGPPGERGHRTLRGSRAEGTDGGHDWQCGRAEGGVAGSAARLRPFLVFVVTTAKTEGFRGGPGTDARPAFGGALGGLAFPALPPSIGETDDETLAKGVVVTLAPRI